jgi:hypothetical protein
MKYGFIITRHVNSEQTNKYWNQSVKLIRTFYPLVKIIIIDDNSNQNFIIPDHEYSNLIVIQSEYPKRGELLPYIYYLKYKWFENAVIIHDSVFIHKKIPFEVINMPILPLWHHPCDKENIENSMRVISFLKNNYKLYNKMNGRETNILGFNYNKYNICFGCQCYINLNFLERINHKYNLINLTNAIHCRTDRCTLERVLGLIFTEESTQLKYGRMKSLFGEIKKHHKSFMYNFNNYMIDFNKGRAVHSFVKVWTGR